MVLLVIHRWTDPSSTLPGPIQPPIYCRGMFYVGILVEVLVITIVRYIRSSTDSEGICFIACSFKSPYVCKRLVLETSINAINKKSIDGTGNQITLKNMEGSLNL